MEMEQLIIRKQVTRIVLLTIKKTEILTIYPVLMEPFRATYIFRGYRAKNPSIE